VKRGAHIVLPGLIFAVLTAFSACTQVPQTPVSTASKPELAEQHARVANEYLVTLAPDADDGIITRYYGRFGIKYLRVLAGETFLLILSNDPGPQKMAALIRDESLIIAVQPNIITANWR
jgi:hypothetical protein